MLSQNDQKILIDLAREAIKTKARPNTIEITDALQEKRGAFVTLSKFGELRGCVGYIEPIMPLYEAVIENAINAAYNDTRFYPLTKDELESLTIEISVLTKPEKLKSLKDLTHEHGVILKNSGRSATFLPQVWEQLTEKEDFLSHLCMKAGLAWDAWKDSKTEMLVYMVYHFDGKF